MKIKLSANELLRLERRSIGTIAEGHKPTCRFLISVAGAAAIECEHGFDSCPTCDPCTCDGAGGRKQERARRS